MGFRPQEWLDVELNKCDQEAAGRSVGHLWLRQKDNGINEFPNDSIMCTDYASSCHVSEDRAGQLASQPNDDEQGQS